MLSYSMLTEGGDVRRACDKISPLFCKLTNKNCYQGLISVRLLYIIYFVALSAVLADVVHDYYVIRTSRSE